MQKEAPVTLGRRDVESFFSPHSVLRSLFARKNVSKVVYYRLQLLDVSQGYLYYYNIVIYYKCKIIIWSTLVIVEVEKKKSTYSAFAIIQN